jgi:glycosyltransferase involved in cell wall biosynthesis
LRNKISRVIRFYSIQNAKLRLTQTRRNSLELKNKFRCKFNYFYPGIDFKIYDKIVKSQRKINLLSICRIEKNKKINWLLQSLIDLKNDNFEIYKKIKLDIVGDGSEKKKLKYFCKKNKIINKVSFLGFVNETKKKNLLKNNHIFLIPAEQGYGIPALEALHYHNKLIINKESRISEIFKNNKGILITCNNYPSFYSGLKLLLKEKNNFFKPNIKILPKSIKWVNFILRKCKWKN